MAPEQSEATCSDNSILKAGRIQSIRSPTWPNFAKENYSVNGIIRVGEVACLHSSLANSINQNGLDRAASLYELSYKQISGTIDRLFPCLVHISDTDPAGRFTALFSARKGLSMSADRHAIVICISVIILEDIFSFQCRASDAWNSRRRIHCFEWMIMPFARNLTGTTPAKGDQLWMKVVVAISRR